MTELTPEEKKFVLVMLENTPLKGTAKDLYKALEMIASIQNKLKESLVAKE
jgi:hypothetical protein